MLNFSDGLDESAVREFAAAALAELPMCEVNGQGNACVNRGTHRVGQRWYCDFHGNLFVMRATELVPSRKP